MGAKVFSTLITEGMALAGRDDLSGEVGSWVKDWLRQTYLSWPWPFLHRSRSALSLPAGTTELTVGSGNGGVTPAIQKVLDPIWVYDSNYQTKQMARVRQLVRSGDAETEERIFDPSVRTGTPDTFKVRAATTAYGVWNLIPMPRPGRDYLLAFDYIELPDDPADGDYPLYPNDMTMVHAATVATLLYTEGHDDDGYRDALQLLASRVKEDRIRFGTVPGTNDQLMLDPAVFK